jgi:hypothetical protein
LPEALSAWNEVLDRYSDRALPGGSQRVLDFTLQNRLVSELGLNVPRLWAWPKDLFIPGGAAWQNYWFFPDTPGHRYVTQWTTPESPDWAYSETGEEWAYASVGPTQPVMHTEAGVGFYFTPSATLATYVVAPTVSLLGTYRWNIGGVVDAGGDITEWVGVYAAAWEVSPVDGSNSLVQPYGLATLFNEFQHDQGTIPITPVTANWSGGPAALNVMLQGGRTYLISVIAAADVRNDWTNNKGGPVGTLPDQSTWAVWCQLYCTVSQVTVDPNVIYIP